LIAVEYAFKNFDLLVFRFDIGVQGIRTTEDGIERVWSKIEYGMIRN